ncbi:hypothetical protein TrRE_jg3659, partial [Triparma retinervis]
MSSFTSSNPTSSNPTSSNPTPPNPTSSSWFTSLAATISSSVSSASIRANELALAAGEAAASKANKEERKRFVEQARTRMDDWGKGVREKVEAGVEA